MAIYSQNKHRCFSGDIIRHGTRETCCSGERTTQRIGLLHAAPGKVWLEEEWVCFIWTVEQATVGAYNTAQRQWTMCDVDIQVINTLYHY